MPARYSREALPSGDAKRRRGLTHRGASSSCRPERESSLLALLVHALLGLVHRFLAASGFGLRFVLGHLTGGTGLVLLGTTLVLHGLVAGHVPGDFLGLPLDVLEDALGASLRPRLSHLATSGCSDDHRDTQISHGLTG